MKLNVETLAKFVRFIEEHDLIGMHPESIAENFIFVNRKKVREETFDWVQGEYSSFPTCTKGEYKLKILQMGYDLWQWQLFHKGVKVNPRRNETDNKEDAIRKVERAYIEHKNQN